MVANRLNKDKTYGCATFARLGFAQAAVIGRLNEGAPQVHVA